MSKKALTDEELFAQFEDIPSADAPSASTAPATGTSTRTPKGTKAAPPAATPAAAAVDEDDPLAELSALAAARPASRPSTPRLSSTTTSSTGTKRAEHTPASSGPPSGRSSEDRLRTPAAPATATSASLRKSTESSRSSLNQSYVAQDSSEQEKVPQYQQQSPQPASASGGGWWGSVFNVATAAVKQAEAAVKEIRGNEDVLKYAEQMKGNAKLLREYGNFSSFVFDMSPHLPSIWACVLGLFSICHYF